MKTIATILIVSIFTTNYVYAQEIVDSSFDAGFLVSDEAFVDTATFGGPGGIQTFLESKGSVLAIPPF